MLSEIFPAGEDISDKFSDERGYDEDITSNLPCDTVYGVFFWENSTPSSDLRPISDLASMSTEGKDLFRKRNRTVRRTFEPTKDSTIAVSSDLLSSKYVFQKGAIVQYLPTRSSKRRLMEIEQIYNVGERVPSGVVLAQVPGSMRLSEKYPLVKTRYLLRDVFASVSLEVNAKDYVLTSSSRIGRPSQRVLNAHFDEARQRVAASKSSFIPTRTEDRLVIRPGNIIQTQKKGKSVFLKVVERIPVGFTYKDTDTYQNKKIWKELSKDQNLYVTCRKPVDSEFYLATYMRRFNRVDGDKCYGDTSFLTVVNACRIHKIVHDLPGLPEFR